jgi:hypothetical protein
MEMTAQTNLKAAKRHGTPVFLVRRSSSSLLLLLLIGILQLVCVLFAQ